MSNKEKSPKKLKEIVQKVNNLAMMCNQHRFEILLILYNSEVLEIGPEFKKKR